MLQCDQQISGDGGGLVVVVVASTKDNNQSDNNNGRSWTSNSLPYSFRSRNAAAAAIVSTDLSNIKYTRGSRVLEHAVQRRQSTIDDPIVDGQSRVVSRYGRTEVTERSRGRDCSSTNVVIKYGGGLGGGGFDGVGQVTRATIKTGHHRLFLQVKFKLTFGFKTDDQGSRQMTGTNSGNDKDYLYGQPHSISVLERLILTHPIWFLRGIYRTGAVHLLQGKEIGNFIIRQSSQPSTMAITVRLPEDKGPYVEHYLVEAIGNNKLRLEGSDFHFSAIPLLVAHYCHCCDELPVQLTLPKSIMEASTKQELSSLAHLGQEFWVSPMATTPTKKSPIPKKPLMPLPLLNTTIQSRPQMITFGSPSSSPSSPSTLFKEQITPTSTSSSTVSSVISSPNRKGPAPDPPPRRFSTSTSPSESPATVMDTNQVENTNFTVTTTVTFHVNQCTASLPVQIDDVEEDVMLVPQPTLTTSTTACLTGSRKRRRRSSHPVQPPTVPVMNIDSPPGYHCSSVADKASDYEDIWLQSPSVEDQKLSKPIVGVQEASEEENQVVRVLKALGLTTENWKNYSTCEANQTDQEKVLARNSQNQIETNVVEPIKIEKIDADTKEERVSVKLKPILKNISTSLTDLHHVVDNGSDDSGGVINDGFNSSSSQLAVNPKAVMIKGDGLSTLPRSAARQATPKRPSLLQQFADFPFDMYINSAATTLTKKQNKSDCKDPLWKLDSSWEWYSRHRDGSEPLESDTSDDEDDYEVYVVENLDEDDVCVVDDSATDNFNQVQMRSNSKSNQRPIGGFLIDPVSTRSSSAVTVEQLLTQKQPELKIPEIKPLTARNLLRVSEYDNMDDDDIDNKTITPSMRFVEVDDASTPQTPSFSLPSSPTKKTTIVRLPKLLNKSDLGDGVQLRMQSTSTRTSSVTTTSNHHHLSIQRKVPSETGSSATEFSEPWDSSRWEQLLMEAATTNHQMDDVVKENRDHDCKTPSKTLSDEPRICLIEGRTQEEELLAILDGSETNSQSTSTLHDDDLIIGAISMPDIHALPCLLSLRRKDRHLGRPIRDYVLKMASDKKLIFGQHIENFIQCTLESNEKDPHITMRNMRQFMSGMANFLVNSGEGKFSQLVQEERAKLKSNEFLNLDTILEGVLHRIVVRPLKRHLCQLFVREYTSSGAVAALSDGIKFARARCTDQLGLKSDLRPLQGSDMEAVKHYFTRLQRAYSPLNKLENLLTAISIIYQSILRDRGGHPQSVGADDFLPMLTYVLVHCGLIAAEIEAEYMWGLLHPSLLSGEGGYYLTTLSSAVHVLKHVQRCHTSTTSKLTVTSMGSDHPTGTATEQLIGSDNKNEGVALCLSELDGFMKVFVPDEQNGNIISKTIPVRPNMTTRDICKMVAHRLSVSNPQDYALYKLANGEENILSDIACPWLVKLELISAGVDCVFAYKRQDAKIAWPVHFKRS